MKKSVTSGAFALSTLLGFSSEAQSVADWTKLVPEDLITLQEQHTEGLTREEVDAQNEAVFKALEEFDPPEGTRSHRGQRVRSITTQTAETVMRSINKHPIVSEYQIAKYDPKENNVEIGFCFGRATYAHLALEEMGLNEFSIKKIWAVGPMVGSGTNWIFHVATVAYVIDPGETKGKWMAVDSYPGRLLEIRAWLDHLKPDNKAGDLRVYITEPHKFSVGLGTYSRVQLGLDLEPEEDWYSGYFSDLVDWFGGRVADRPARRKEKDALGLVDLRTGACTTAESFDRKTEKCFPTPPCPTGEKYHVNRARCEKVRARPARARSVLTPRL